MSKPEKTVEKFNRVNRLRGKAGGSDGGGAGRFEQTSLDRADAVIESMSSLYPKEIENMIGALHEQWVELKQSGEERSTRVEKISHTANQIKDLAGTFGYSLMADFGDSLCSYILETALSRDEHFKIVQAHIDVMDVAFKRQLRDDGGEMGRELKQTVQKAIDKYH